MNIRPLHIRTAAAFALLPGIAAADFELYDDDRSTLSFYASVVTAGFLADHAWFGQSESFLGASTDSWAEFGTEAGVRFEYTDGRSTWFAELSGIYTETGHNDASGQTIGVPKTADLDVEQAHFGWRLDDPFSGLENDAFSLTLGRQDYLVGTALLIGDGSSDGGEKGGWYIGMRKTFQEAVVASLASDTLVAEGFFLKNRPRYGGVQGKVYGINLEYTLPSAVTAGLTIMQVDARIPDADDLDVISTRLGWNGLGGLELSGEYVLQDSSQVDANGWYGAAAWSFEDSRWSPWIGYRYAQFDGDDPATSTDERFREIAYGFTDYGWWFQGEITGSYPLGNGNVTSHLVQFKVSPHERLSFNAAYYDFSLDQPAALDPGVTSSDWGDEFNLIANWTIAERWTATVALAALLPGAAAKQWVGGNETWLSSMLYLSWSL